MSNFCASPDCFSLEKKRFQINARCKILNKKKHTFTVRMSLTIPTSLYTSTIERRDSKTPAGDMWHVLNINRRVEAAEAAIQGMTNLIDTINSDLYEMKNNTSSMSVSPVVTETVNNNSNTNNIEKLTTESVAVRASGVAIAKV